jgi:hypothetical protein
LAKKIGNDGTHGIPAAKNHYGKLKKYPVDCTHIHGNKCRKQWQNVCIGKEAYPTLSFLVIVDHNRRAMAVSDAFFGACNDKMIVKNVEETKAFMCGSMEHVSYPLYLYDAERQHIKLQGGPNPCLLVTGRSTLSLSQQQQKSVVPFLPEPSAGMEPTVIIANNEHDYTWE